MRILRSIPALLTFSLVQAATWSFDDGKVVVQKTNSKIKQPSLEQKLEPNKFLPEFVGLQPDETLHLSLTVTNGKQPRRPHQAFLSIEHPENSLAETYAFNVKESGKAKIVVPHSAIPTALLSSKYPLKVTIMLASFGSSTPYQYACFALLVAQGSIPTSSLSESTTPLRYQALPQITHTFRPDPRSPPKAITLVFTAAVLAALVGLLGTWARLGANLKGLGRAVKGAPAGHLGFVASILTMEGVFAAYYMGWSLGYTLPVVGAVAVVALLSGAAALGEVQERRLRGER